MNYGLYPTPDFLGRAGQSYSGAARSTSMFDKERRQPPGKSAGGALSSAASMGMAGMQVGSYFDNGSVLTTSQAQTSGMSQQAAAGSEGMQAMEGAESGMGNTGWGGLIGVGVGLGSYLLS